MDLLLYPFLGSILPSADLRDFKFYSALWVLARF